MNNAVIVGAARTAVGKRNGKLSTVRPDDLLAETLKALVARTGIDPAEVEDVVIGCVDQLGEQGLNIQREPADEGGVARDVQSLLAELINAADDHVLHLGGIDARARHQGLERLGEEVVGTNGGELAVALADSSASRPHDHCVVHVLPPLAMRGPSISQARRRLTWSLSLQNAQISPVVTWPHTAHSFSTVGSACAKAPRAFSRKPKRKLCLAPGEASSSRSRICLWVMEVAPLTKGHSSTM